MYNRKYFMDKIKESDYDFLKTEKSLGENIILLTLGGSHAYGTNNEDSDIDIRGVAKEGINELIGLSKFEQFEHRETDTVIYGFSKFISLLLNNNPNTLEILGAKDEHYLKISKEGKMILDNKNLFLSQKVIRSFSNYAKNNLNRLENALARDRLSQEKKEKHILNSLESAMTSFDERYSKFTNGSIRLFIDASNKKEFDKEIFANIKLDKYPLRDLNGIISELTSIVRLYSKLNSRNNKKDEQHLDKHAMHVVRLLLVVIDILEKKEIIVYRKENIVELLSIRNGLYRKDDSTYYPEFFEYVKKLQDRVDYAAKNTDLRVEPDYDKIEEFVVEVNKKIING